MAVNDNWEDNWETESTIVKLNPQLKQTLQLSILFLQKFERLTSNERKIFSSLIHTLANPLVQINRGSNKDE